MNLHDLASTMTRIDSSFLSAAVLADHEDSHHDPVYVPLNGNPRAGLSQKGINQMAMPAEPISCYHRRS